MYRLKFLTALAAGVGAAGLLTASVYAYATYARYSYSSVPFYLNPQNMDVSADAAELDVVKAAANWSTQSNAAFAFSYAGRSSDTNISYDNRDVVIFRNATNGAALATT